MRLCPRADTGKADDIRKNGMVLGETSDLIFVSLALFVHRGFVPRFFVQSLISRLI